MSLKVIFKKIIRITIISLVGYALLSIGRYISEFDGDYNVFLLFSNLLMWPWMVADEFIKYYDPSIKGINTITIVILQYVGYWMLFYSIDISKKYKNLIMNFWNGFISLISGEVLLDNRDNGGSVIALRSIILSSIIFLVILLCINLLDPNRSLEPSFSEFRIQVINKITWFGVLFGSVYAALYTRFSSQWAYLANLYNTIKQASCNETVSGDRLAEWKAGFIEDAEYLHLAHKENFVSIIHVWGKEELVKQKYISFTPGGESRYRSLMDEVDSRYSIVCLKNTHE